MGENRWRLIAADLDGTLLRGSERLSPYTLSVFARCRAAGIRVAIVTARSYRRTEGFLKELSCDAVAVHNGAAVYFGEEKDTRLCIPAETAASILRALHATFPHMPVMADSRETLYADFDTAQVWPDVHAVQTDFSDFPPQEAEKILGGVDGAETVERVRALLPGNMRLEWLVNFIRITNREAGKLAALRHICERFGVAPEDCVAFGDSANDAAMLRGAGTGVAVSNAEEAAKSAADEIALSNDRDGPAKFLESHLFSPA